MSDEFTTVFPPYYEGAEMSRGTAGWENPPYYLTAYGLAVKRGYTGTEEEWLASLKGEPGPGIVVLGHYDTLAELEEAVTEPEDGDMYDVGSGASQLIYYWSSAQEDWKALNVHGPQGERGPAGADGSDGVDGADGASAYEQAVEAGYTGTEQEFMALLAELPGYTEQARLWAVTAGEAETAAEGYAEAAEAAVAGFVPNTRTVNGKSLSADITLDADDVGAAAAASLGEPEASAAATRNHAEGDLFELGGDLIVALTAIASGETFDDGTNIETTTVAAQFAARDTRIAALEDALDGLVARLGAI